MVHESLFQAQNKKVRSPLILAAKKTIDLNLYAQEGFSTIYPSSEDQLKISEIIQEVASGCISRIQAQALEKIIEAYAEADGVILACTELPLIQRSFPLNITKPVINTTEVLARKLLREAKGP